MDLVIHDYSWFCPRISLTDGNYRYCREPAIAACRDCVAKKRHESTPPVWPDQLVDRTLRLTEAARSIIAPSRDAARRIEKRFDCEVAIGDWEPPRRFALREICEAAGQTRPVRVCVVGAIGYEKGYDSLLRCAGIVAAADMPIEFVVVGYTCDDKHLLETGECGYQDDTRRQRRSNSSGPKTRTSRGCHRLRLRLGVTASRRSGRWACTLLSTTLEPRRSV